MVLLNPPNKLSSGFSTFKKIRNAHLKLPRNLGISQLQSKLTSFFLHLWKMRWPCAKLASTYSLILRGPHILSVKLTVLLSYWYFLSRLLQLNAEYMIGTFFFSVISFCPDPYTEFPVNSTNLNVISRVSLTISTVCNTFDYSSALFERFVVHLFWIQYIVCLRVY